MKKVFYLGMIILMIVSFVGFIYQLIDGDGTRCIYLMFTSIITGLMALLVEPGNTKEQEDKVFGILLLVIGAAMVLVLASCSSRSGYGCKGKESWKQLERRINRP